VFDVSLIASHSDLSLDLVRLDLLYPLWVVYTFFMWLLGLVLAPPALFVLSFLIYELVFA
jgi:predicted outer membrane lipoprotein